MGDTTPSGRVRAAITAMKAADPEYWASCLRQRLADGAGSRTGFTSQEELERALLEAEWEEYSHPEVGDRCHGFVTHDIGGLLGVVSLTDLPGDLRVELKDPKKTGKLQAHVRKTDVGLGAIRVSFLVAILGIEDNEERVFTFHPGEPVKARGMKGKNPLMVTVAEAIGLGFTTAKVEG